MYWGDAPSCKQGKMVPRRGQWKLNGGFSTKVNESSVRKKTISRLFSMAGHSADPALWNPRHGLARRASPPFRGASHPLRPWATEVPMLPCPHLHVKVLSGLRCPTSCWHRHMHKPFLMEEGGLNWPRVCLLFRYTHICAGSPNPFLRRSQCPSPSLSANSS